MRLSPDDIAAGLAGLPGWTFERDALSRRYRFPSFPDAVAFVTRLAFAAEAADHHPDMLVSYRNVTVTWTTHSAGGVTAKDLEGARETERVRVTLAPDKA